MIGTDGWPDPGIGCVQIPTGQHMIDAHAEPAGHLGVTEADADVGKGVREATPVSPVDIALDGHVEIAGDQRSIVLY